MLLAGVLIKEQLVLRPVARFLRKVQLVAKLVGVTHLLKNNNLLLGLHIF
jgi:hypothetical protein